MRNDVKLGFAVGGVLLAVLIVYVLVVPGGNTPRQVTKNTPTKPDGKVTLEPVSPPSAPSQEFTPGAADKPANGGGAAVAADKAGGAGTAKAETTPRARDTQKDAVADATKPDAAGGAGAGKDVDWDKLLNGPPVLMTQTPVKTSSAETKAPVAEQSAPTGGDATAGSSTPQAGEQLPPTMLAEGPATRPSSGSEISTARGAGSAIAGGATASGERTHKVQLGETLSSISAAAYGTPNQYPAILRANPGLDPNRLKPGMVVNLPDLKDIKPAAASARVASEGDAQHAGARVGAAPLTAKQYRVEPQDNLYRIAVKLYGKGTLANKIYELNKQTIGDDPAKLKVGQVLELPEAPTVTTSAR